MDDYDWYVENVIVAGGPADGGRGPMWEQTAAWDAIARRCRVGSAAERLAARQGFVLTPRQARMIGIDRSHLRSMVRHRRWADVRRGAVSVLAPPDNDDSGAPHGLRPEVAAAASVLVRPGLVISDESAAAACGIPLLDPVRRPTLTSTVRQDACDWPDIVIRVARLDAADRTEWYGAATTTIARTVCDLARHSIRSGLVAADAALYEKRLTHAELDDVIGRQRGWPGVRTARLVAALASPLSESPLESLVRLFLNDRDVPLPEQQVWLDTYRGRYRVDGLWSDRAVVLEVDGMGKYKPGSLTAEKVRQEALERAGYRVVRVTWEDIHRFPAQTLARIQRALRVGGDRIR